MRKCIFLLAFFIHPLWVVALPSLNIYQFTPTSNKTLPGNSTENRPSAYGCTGGFNTNDQIGHLSLIVQFYQNGCYTDGRYNHNQYLVEEGSLIGSNGGNFTAYRIHEPSHKASNFLASQHSIYYQFPSKEDYAIYELSGSTLNKITTVSATSINTTTFVPVNDLSASTIEGSRTFVFVPAMQKLSVFSTLDNGVEGAQLKTTVLGNVLKYRYPVNNVPFDTRLDFTGSPNTWSNVYALTKQFFLLPNNNNLGMLWQDQNNAALYLTWMGTDLQSPHTVSLPNNSNEDLAAVTHDGAGGIFYLTIQEGSGTDTEIARTATLYVVNQSGQLLRKKSLDTSRNALNMVTFTHNNAADLHYLNGKLGLMLARQMHRGNDGLNHQGAIAVVFDASSLNMLRNLGQTSGHSLDNILLTGNSQGEFLGLDLGDNYPRGVNLHKFSDASKRSRVVYTFKTEHGQSANSPAGAVYPMYTNISNGSKTYYQWSNDNRMYSELGGVIETDKGYVVIFAGEAANGRALDNSRVGKYLNDPRNIGMVLVRKDFENASGSGNEVSDDLILTSGLTESGGFYTFNGTWSAQRNKGVVWLTNYQNSASENASRLKAVPLTDGNIMVLWEKWTASNYVNSYAMKITDTGNIITPPAELGEMVRLNRTDDPLVINNAVYLAAGDKNDKKLELIVINPDTPSQQPNYTLNLSINGSGTVSSNPAGIHCSTTCSASYSANNSVSLTAIATNGYRFSSWGGACGGSAATITLTMTAAKNCSATFTNSTTARLINISTRAKVSSGQDAAIAGFVLSGSGSKRVLIKALGASMQDAGVATQLDPSIDLFDMRNTSAPTHSNRAWGNDSRANDVPQHLRPPRSQESAILYDLSAGAYTAIVNPEQNSGDVGLVSVDEISGDDSLKLINISTRALVDSGQNNAIAGFVIQGEGTLKVLIKAAGQSLRDAGINTSLDPKLTLVDMQTRATLAENDDWGSHPRLSEVPSAVRPTHSQDAMLVMDLSAGAYTALVSPMGVSGVGLVSVDLLQ